MMRVVSGFLAWAMLLLGGCGVDDQAVSPAVPTAEVVASDRVSGDSPVVSPEPVATSPSVDVVDWSNDPKLTDGFGGYLSDPSIVYAFSRSDVVVRADTLRVASTQVFDAVDGGTIEYRPLQITVNEVFWQTLPSYNGYTVPTVSPGAIDVVDRLPGVLDEAASQSVNVVLGLDTIGPNSVAKYGGAHFALSFVASTADGVLTMLGRENTEYNRQLAALYPAIPDDVAAGVADDPIGVVGRASHSVGG